MKNKKTDDIKISYELQELYKAVKQEPLREAARVQAFQEIKAQVAELVQKNSTYDQALLLQKKIADFWKKYPTSRGTKAHKELMDVTETLGELTKQILLMQEKAKKQEEELEIKEALKKRKDVVPIGARQKWREKLKTTQEKKDRTKNRQSSA